MEFLRSREKECSFGGIQFSIQVRLASIFIAQEFSLFSIPVPITFLPNKPPSTVYKSSTFLQMLFSVLVPILLLPNKLPSDTYTSSTFLCIFLYRLSSFANGGIIGRSVILAGADR